MSAFTSTMPWPSLEMSTCRVSMMRNCGMFLLILLIQLYDSSMSCIKRALFLRHRSFVCRAPSYTLTLSLTWIFKLGTYVTTALVRSTTLTKPALPFATTITASSRSLYAQAHFR